MPANFDWRPILAAVSSVLPHIEQQRAREAQSDILAAGRADVAARQREIDQRLADEVAAMEASNPQAERTAALADYTQALQQMRARGQASEAEGVPLVEAAQREAGQHSQAYGRNMASQQARITAPLRQRTLEQQRLARAGSAIETEQRHAGADQFIAELRARQQRADPWVAILSQLGTSIAKNYTTEDEELAPGRVRGSSASSTTGRLPRPGQVVG